MRKLAIGSALWMGLAVAPAIQAAPLTSLQNVHQLSNEQAASHASVDFDATVTFYRSYEGTLFVQDGDAAIYVQPVKRYDLAAGDRVHVHGNVQESFRPIVAGATITVLHHGSRPVPSPARFDELIQARFDCRYVRVRGRVLSADIVMSSDRPGTSVQLQMNGGTVDVQIDSNNPGALPPLLDAEIEVTGVASGRFDGKMEMTGLVLHAQTLSDLKVLKSDRSSPWSAPLTPIQEIVSEYRASNGSKRVHVQGTVTYFMPGSAVVLQNGSRSVWVNSRVLSGVEIGHMASATGFPDVRDGFLKLTDGEILDSGKAAPVQPIPVTGHDLTRSIHVFDLVSIDSQIVAEIREAGQDVYVLMSDGHLFSAVLRHPRSSAGSSPPQTMKRIQPGSRVHVSGICILEDSNPFNSEVPFDILLRSSDDIALIAKPSALSVTNLMKAVRLLLVLVVVMFAWGWMLNQKVTRQSRILARQIKAEAALARYNAEIEQRRSRVLEDLNGSRPLAELLEEITELVSFRLRGAPCWCEISDGVTVGRFQAEAHGRRVVREEIAARTGPPLGTLCAALDVGNARDTEEEQAFFQGTRLATLAIETRRAFTDLVHRSEFDLLTDVHNRFSLDKRIDSVIATVREHSGSFGLVYVDLDEFKQVNDIYGHRVGDMYLQEACARMKNQLRSGDILARLGGDEFVALVPGARGRNDVDEIASRLERCFDHPFRLEGYILHGSASLGTAMYPEDGTTRESLLTSADAAMYVAKHTARSK